MPTPPTTPSGGLTAAQFEQLAVELAEGAARLVREGRTAVVTGAGAAGAVALGIEHKSSDTDPVTELDRRAEQWLRAELADRRPDDSVLGEEGGQTGTPTGGSGVRWVLDPIDGTVNFVLGIPHYAVSVGVEVDGTVVAGAVTDIALGETYRASRGGGARLSSPLVGELPLTGPRQVSLSRAVVGTGFGYDAGLRARQAAAAARWLPRVADLRRPGSAALALGYVAAGRLDGYVEAGLNYWDHAAGALIATEAGCVVHGVDGQAPSPRLVLAAGPQLAPELYRLLVDTGADRVLTD